MPVIAAFSLGSCAKPESATERNAEIDRRVDQRLEAKHQAEERLKLALRQAELDARERALTAQENSFATMTASVPSAAIAGPADAGVIPRTDSYTNADSYSGPETYSPYPATGGQFYPEPYGFDSANEPYLGESPYYFAPATSFVTVVNQNTRIVYLRRGHSRPRCRQPNVASSLPIIPRQLPRQPSLPPQPSLPRQMGTRHPPTAGVAIQTSAHGPTRPPVEPQVINRRPTGRVALQRTR